MPGYVHLAAYKSDGRLMNRVISFVTKDRYTHTEIIFPNGDAFSSSQWDGGVRFKLAMALDPEKWDTVPVGPLNVEELRAWCEQQNGKKYGWLDLARLYLNRGMQSADRWFCSEICTAAFQTQGFFMDLIPSRTSPGLLAAVAKGMEEERERTR